MVSIILSTRNTRKGEEVAALFEGSPIRLLTLEKAGIGGNALEDGRTLEANASSKAWFAHERSDGKCWTVADDTGLFIRALRQAPGVHTAIWGGRDLSARERMQYCLEQMHPFKKDRFATFRTVVCAVGPHREEMFFHGEVYGDLLEEPRVEPHPHMPFAPLFVPRGQELSLAEMTVDEENAISHRGQAFRKLRAFLEAQA
jgi:XTP/dITP diphosphohydrolase